MKKSLKRKLFEQNLDKCPYLNDPDCGRPNKDPLKFCALYRYCTSYKLLKTIDDYEEEKKDGEHNTGEDS